MLEPPFVIISRYNSEISQNWKNDLLINSSHFPLKAATIWGVGLTGQVNFLGWILSFEGRVTAGFEQTEVVVKTRTCAAGRADLHRAPR